MCEAIARRRIRFAGIFRDKPIAPGCFEVISVSAGHPGPVNRAQLECHTTVTISHSDPSWLHVAMIRRSEKGREWGLTGLKNASAVNKIAVRIQTKQ